jgi:hypothetical protein
LAYSRARSIALNLTPAALPTGATASGAGPGGCLTSGQLDPTKTIDVTVSLPYSYHVPFIPDPNPGHKASATAKGVRCGG